MVDRPKVESRLERLRLLLDELEQIRAAGRAPYDSELRQRLATQRALQLAIQACIDIAGHLLAESGKPIPPNYREALDHLDDLRGFAAFTEARLG